MLAFPCRAADPALPDNLFVTGALYLFKDEIDLRVHRAFLRVAPTEAPLRPSALVAAAPAAQPGQAVKYTDPPPRMLIEVVGG